MHGSLVRVGGMAPLETKKGLKAIRPAAILAFALSLPRRRR
jgi:hypothetical protein